MFSAPTHPDVSLETVSGEGKKKEKKTKISNSISLSTDKWKCRETLDYSMPNRLNDKLSDLKIDTGLKDV